jgi:tetraprenyl-beta-curcumene synthase
MSSSATVSAPTEHPRRAGGAITVERPPAASALADRRLLARANLALVLANVRYWSSVAPLVRRELERWRRRAQTIEDPILRALALQKLHKEGFNAEVAATLATLAPRAHRARTVEAIVALEVLFDYLDGLTESPSHDAPADSRLLFGAFIDAVTVSIGPDRDYYRLHPRSRDNGYLQALSATVRAALAELPAREAVADVLIRGADRAAEAQIQIHSASIAGTLALERWATLQASGTPLEWREFLAGAASSVLAVHAVIAAAASRRTTYEQAVAIDRAYMSIAVLPTVLDSLIDYDDDAAVGRPGYLRFYEDRAALGGRLARVVREAVNQARTVPNGAHHVMTLVGVVAYYASAPSASSELARPITAHVERQLRPLITPTLVVMRAWRVAKLLRCGRCRRDASSTPSEARG